MKNILIVLLNLTMFATLYAQEEQVIPLVRLGEYVEQEDVVYYYKDVNGDLNKFLGTWKFEDNTTELIIKIYLNEHADYFGSYYDDIYIKFKYIENGIVIYDTLLDDSESNKYVIFGPSIFEDTRNKVTLSYFEPTDIPYDDRGFMPSLNLELLPCTVLNCVRDLKWDIFWVNGANNVWPFKIPSNLVLEKQE
ncbi:DUF6705 family protein [Lacinutrix undariae]